MPRSFASTRSTLLVTLFCTYNFRTTSLGRPSWFKSWSSSMPCWLLSQSHKKSTSHQASQTTKEKVCSYCRREFWPSYKRLNSQIPSSNLPQTIRKRLSQICWWENAKLTWLNARKPSPLRTKSSGANGRRTSAPSSRSLVRSWLRQENETRKNRADYLDCVHL